MIRSSHYRFSHLILFLAVSFLLIFTCTSPALGQTLQVFIQPSGAVSAGAQWMIVGEGIWYNSGYEAEVALGTVEITFKSIFGWTKPSNQTINVTVNQKYQRTGTYQQLQGQLKVSIRPAEIAATAKWRISALDPKMWYSSGQTIQIPYGIWPIDFKSIRGYIPPTKSVIINSSALKSVTATYQKLIVGKIRIIGNQLTKTGNNFSAQGKIRLAFAKPGGGYTDEIISITGTLSGTFSPPTINGNGALSVSGNAFSLPLFQTNAFFNGSFSLNAQTLEVKNLNFRAGVKFMGFEFDIKRFQFSPDPFYLSLSVDLDISEPIFGAGGYIYLKRLDLQKGQLPVVIGRAQLNDCNVFDWIVIEDTYIDINTTTKSFTLNAGLIALDDLLPPFSGAFKLENGKLVQLKLAVYDADIAFVKSVPLYLQDLGFDLRNPGSKLGQIQTNIRFTVLPNDIALAELEGNLFISWTGEFWGTLYQHALLGFRSSTSYVHFYPGKKIDNTYSGTYAWGLIRMSGATTVAWKPKFSFSGSGSGTVGFTVPKAFRWLVKKQLEGDRLYLAGWIVAVSQSGFDASAKILGFIPVSIHVDPANKMPGEEIVRVETVAPPVEKRIFIGGFSPVGNTYLVKEDTPAVVFTGVSELKTPYLVLVQPDGKKIDPKGDLPPESKNFMYRQDDEDKAASFLIGKPIAGTWTVNLKNSSQAGKTEILFFKANNDPQIIPDRIEKITDKYYKVYLEAYDPDNKAQVTLFWDNDNRDFNGVSVGTAVEKDGEMVFDWEPEDHLMNSGYLYAEIDDGQNPPVRAYFEENIKLVKSTLPKPQLRSCKVVSDELVLRIKLKNPEEVSNLKIYYSSDLKQKVLTQYAVAQVNSKIILSEGPINPGRRYQLKVAAVDKQGGETEMSIPKKVKYKAKKSNNHPFFTSKPILETEAGKEYSYVFRAADWDKDPLTYSLESGPDGMALDSASRTLRWTPENNNTGDNFVVLAVSDGRGGEDRQAYTLKVMTASTPIVRAETKLIQKEDGSALEVQVIDHLANADSNIQDKLEVRIVGQHGYGELRLILYEISANSGIFKGYFDLSTDVSPMPYWLLSKSTYGSEHELSVNWIVREGIIREIRTVLD